VSKGKLIFHLKLPTRTTLKKVLIGEKAMAGLIEGQVHA
jgi:hypothetical protein